MRYFARFAALLTLSLLLGFTVQANDEGAKPEKPAKTEKPTPPPQEALTLTGKIVKKEGTSNKGGVEKTWTKYILVTATGEINLPNEHKAKAGEVEIDYDAHVNQDVTVAAMGYTKTKTKDGKEVTMTKIDKVNSITPVEAAAPAAEAAAEAPAP